MDAVKASARATRSPRSAIGGAGAMRPRSLAVTLGLRLLLLELKQLECALLLRLAQCVARFLDYFVGQVRAGVVTLRVDRRIQPLLGQLDRLVDAIERAVPVAGEGWVVCSRHGDSVVRRNGVRSSFRSRRQDTFPAQAWAGDGTASKGGGEDGLDGPVDPEAPESSHHQDPAHQGG